MIRGCSASFISSMVFSPQHGGNETAERLEHELEHKYHGVLQPTIDNPESTNLSILIYDLGLMARRNVPAAQRIVKNMVTDDYWQDTDFAWLPPEVNKPAFTNANRTRMEALSAFAVSNMKGLEQVRQPDARSNCFTGGTETTGRVENARSSFTTGLFPAGGVLSAVAVEGAVDF